MYSDIGHHMLTRPQKSSFTLHSNVSLTSNKAIKRNNSLTAEEEIIYWVQWIWRVQHSRL